ncbi:MAG: YkgJ family cysteine cluster protein [Bacteroidales bacterium]|nr:YkgJ family cysteine cluster protein [Bacteroidales bacterium]
MLRLTGSLGPANKAFLEKLGKTKPGNLDKLVHKLHDEVFEKINCLECANCCKALGPMLFESDIDRMSSALKMKSSAFKDKYIKMDEDGDYVFNQSPCPFLCPDNYCMIYENRPKACREYPHTNRRRFYQLSIKTYYNTFTCPAVFEIVNELKKNYK